MVRIIWNVFSILIGAMFGGTVWIVTVIILFLLASVIEMVKLYIRKIIYGGLEKYKSKSLKR